MSRHLRGAIFKIFSNHGGIMPKLQHYLLSFPIQVLKMIKIGNGCSKIQLTRGRNKILDMRMLCRINKHFTLKCLPLGGELTFSTIWGGNILAGYWDLDFTWGEN